MNQAWKRVALAGLIVLLARTPALAEVSTDGSGPFVDTLILGTITEDSDPVGIWLQYRPVSSNQVLNADGDARGDGRPDIVWKQDSSPVAVWAYNVGGDFDIAFSEWDGAQWTATAFLTSSTDDERDPRLFVEPDGTTHVVWWTAGSSDEVYLATRQAGEPNWDMPVLVTAGSESGRRPSVATFDGELVVVYERDSLSPEMAQDIVVATRQLGGAFAFATIGTTARTEPLDVLVHSEPGHLWADWKHEAGEFGYAERQSGGGWDGLGPEPWVDPSWVGVEETRKAIRNQVLE